MSKEQVTITKEVVVTEDPLKAKPNLEAEWMPEFGKGGKIDIYQDEMSDDEQQHVRGFEKSK